MAEAKVIEIRSDGSCLVQVEGDPEPQVGQLHMRSGGMLLVRSIAPDPTEQTKREEGDPHAQTEVREDHREAGSGKPLASGATPEPAAASLMGAASSEGG